MGIAYFQAPTRLVFGAGAISELGPTAQRLGLRRLLLVTDAGLVATGIPARVCDVLGAAGAEVVCFDAVEANPSIETACSALDVYREQGCDSLMAVGGGSPMDAAKAAAILASNGGGLLDYVGAEKVRQPLPPLLAVPTTVGTGSEVTPFAVITDRAQRRKVVINSPYVSPAVSFLDPELVVDLPAGLVAGTAMDAMTHAIESVTCNFASPFTDGLAFEAIRMIHANLPRAVARHDLEPRAALLYASTMAGQAFSYGRTGLVHGMAHPLSAYYDAPHGLANAILLPHVLAYNAPACEAALARVSVALGGPPAAASAVESIRLLSAEAGIPRGLRALGVTEAYIPQMAQDAYTSGNAQVVNPRRPSLEDVIRLYEQAL